MTSLWITWALLLGTLVIAAYVSLTQAASELERRNRTDLTAVTDSIRSLIETYLDERRNDARLLAGRPEVSALLAQSQSTKASEANAHAAQVAMFQSQQIFGYHEVKLIDREQRVVGQGVDASLTPDQLLATKLAIESGKAHFVDMHETGDCAPCVGFVQPVFLGNDRTLPPIGATLLLMSASRDLYRFLRSSDSVEALLLKADGNEVVYLSPLKKLPSAPALSVRRSLQTPHLLAAKATAAKKVEAFDGVDYTGTAVAGAVSLIRGTPWALVVKSDLSTVHTPLRDLQWKIMLGAALFALLLIMAARLILRIKAAETQSNAMARDAAFASAKNLSVDGYVLISDDGHILEANPAIAHLSGFTEKELVGKHLSEMDAHQTPAQIAETLVALQNGTAAAFDTKWRHRDGHLLDLRVSTTYIRLEGRGYHQAYLRDIGPELASLEREQRLRQMYECLSGINAAIHRLRTRDEVMAAVVDAAVQQGGFLLAWVGIEDQTHKRVLPVAVRGVGADYIKKIVVTTDPELPTSQGPTRRAMVTRTIQTIGDFETDPQATPWRNVADAQGIQSSAAVPIVVSNEVIAVVSFYSARKQHFDTEICTLLTEIATNLSLALQTLEFGRQVETAETLQSESQARFARVFEASPIPMQILSMSTQRMLAVNRAMQSVFGYSLEDIPTGEQWYRKAYPDEELRAQLLDIWTNTSLPQALSAEPGHAVTSPKIPMRCKDGTEKIARGYMSVVGDEIIIQWQDLTEIHEAGQRLEQNEARFRSMIEQTLLGIYVTQNDRIVYANPRFCEIVGWTYEELIGQDSLAFIGRDEADRQLAIQARKTALAAGMAELQSLPFRHRDGRLIDIGLQPTMGLWDGQPALVVMAQDLTERKRAEENVARYIKQLEGTMAGTLQAVARMVDLRDPYTSGHEKRVGIIAADIARALGWEEGRCQNLQLIGLVHDIGKIAIPAELLAKPTKLTALEYEMIKTHVEKGYEILKDVVFPIPIADIIRQHHERLDGSGYPRGLIGSDILPEARILAVADVLESMASHRPYRAALGMEVALKELEAHKGDWFDPAVVATVVRMVRDEGYQLPD